MSNKVEQITESIVKDLLDDEYELVDLEYVKEGSLRYLRIYIDKSGQMSLTDCEKLSRLISDKLDEVDPIQENYLLEISSPGLDRVLKKEKDFIREKGKEVEIKLYRSMNGCKELEGTLLGLNEADEVEIDIQGKQVNISRKEIAIIRLAVKI